MTSKGISLVIGITVSTLPLFPWDGNEMRIFKSWITCNTKAYFEFDAPSSLSSPFECWWMREGSHEIMFAVYDQRLVPTSLGDVGFLCVSPRWLWIGSSLFQQPRGFVITGMVPLYGLSGVASDRVYSYSLGCWLWVEFIPTVTWSWSRHNCVPLDYRIVVVDLLKSRSNCCGCRSTLVVRLMLLDKWCCMGAWELWTSCTLFPPFLPIDVVLRALMGGIHSYEGKGWLTFEGANRMLSKVRNCGSEGNKTKWRFIH
jgi:hypothetical protein